MQVAIVVALLVGGAPAWKSFVPPSAGFEVMLPTTPTEKRQTVRTPLGNGELRIFSVSHKGGAFAVGVTEFPESALTNTTDDQRLEQARDGAVQQSKGKIRWEKTLRFEGMPGRELMIGADGASTATLLILAADRNRLYQIVAIGDTAFLEGPETLRFLDSFRRRK
jgi:hypothetical protein